MVGVFVGEGKAAVAKVLRVEKKPKRQTEYIVKADGVDGEMKFKEDFVYSQDWAVKFNKTKENGELRGRVAELAEKLNTRSAENGDTWVKRLLSRGATQSESYFRGPRMFVEHADSSPVVNGVNASELHRVCVEADSVSELKKQNKLLRYVTAYLAVTKSGSVDEARDWVERNMV
jgi:hypothetical protein